MRKILLLVFVVLKTGVLFSQTFTKVTTGAIVNDGKSSFGSAWTDIDNDRDLDLFVSNVYSEDDSLYLNNGNGTFYAVNAGSIVNDGRYSYNSTWADYDNDGDEDGFVANGDYTGAALNSLFNNNGNGTFTQITGTTIVNDPMSSDGSAWADYDNDGWLDLYVVNFLNGQAHCLYHNNGNGTFSKITNSPLVTNIAYSPSCSWADYDNDGDQDVFVANYGTLSFFFQNNGSGNFTKIITGAISSVSGHSISGSWGDYDNDGYLDLFVNKTLGEFPALYHNNGNGTFTQILTSPIVNSSGYGTGSSWGDYDNDGWLDLIVATSSADPGISLYNKLYHNNGNGTFSQVSTGPFTTDVSNARGVTWADYDNDGDLDLHFANEFHTDDFFI